MSLRTIVEAATGQDVRICHACNDCDLEMHENMDIPLSSLIQLIILNDEEALECRTVWSDSVIESARSACKRGLDLQHVLKALREESKRRDKKI